jgi:hypothetical protein
MKIEEFIKTRLWPSIDSYISWKYCRGDEIDTKDLMEKAWELDKILKNNEESTESSIEQAKFIIRNIFRNL